MPTIAIVRSHALSHKAAKEAAQRVVDDLRARFALDYAWDGDDVAFERPGVSGRLHVGKDEVALEVKLGLLLGALKSTVEREIHQQLDELFATPDKAAARKPRSTAKAAAAGVHAKAPGGHARPAARGAAATGRKASGRAKG
jgi:putative polyhydroxyalkanoate system protein